MPPFLYTIKNIHLNINRITMRLTSALLISLSLLCTSFTYASSEDDYEKALTAYSQARFDEAFIHLKNSLQQDPDNLAAKILMGKLLLVNGYLQAAEAEFYEALDQGADINLVAEALGNALLFQNKYQRVINFSDIDKLSAAEKIKWLQIRATACIRLKRTDCAIDAYKQSLKLDDKYVPAYNGLASVAISEEQYAAANKYLEQANGYDSKNAVTWRLQGELAREQGQYDEAIDKLKTALQLAPEDPLTLRKMADIYLESNDFESAQAFVDEIVEKTPNDPLAILLSSWLESKDQEKLVNNDRLEQLNEIMNSLSPELIADQPVLYYISGLTAFFHGNTEQATRDFTQYLQQNPNDPQAVVLLARTYLMTQQNRQALTLLEKHEDKLLENVDSALLLGDLYLKQNRAFKAQKLSDALSERYPEDSRVSLFRIRLMAIRGKTDEALGILDQNYDKNQDNITFLFTYSMMKLQAGYETDALKAANAILKTYPNDADFLNLKAGILIRLKRYDEALSLIETTLEKKPNLFAAKFNKAAILSRLGDYTQSNLIVDELLAVSPKHPQSLLLKAHNMVKENQVEEALSLYSDILVLNNDFTYARFELAKLYQAIKDYDQAIYHIDRLLVNDFDNPEYLLFKTALYIQKRNILEAQKTLSVAEHFTKDSVEYLVRQSELQQAIDDLPAAIKSLDAALVLAPKNTRLNLVKARLLIETDELTAAKNLLNSLRAENEDNANFWLTQALYANASDNRPQATKDLIKALGIDPYFHQALVMLYEFAIRGGDKEVFVTQAEAIVKTYPKNILAKNILAQFYYIEQDFTRARALYKSLLKQEESINRPMVLNTLAIMALDEDIEVAHKYITQAFELNSTHPEILDTLGWVLVQKGQLEDGLGHLRKAFARDSNNPEIRYHIGFALVKLNRNKEAIEELQKAVSVQRPFYNRNKAQTLLDSIQ